MSSILKKSILPFFLIVLSVCNISCFAQELERVAYSRLVPGANQTEFYFPLLADKTIALVANQTSRIGDTHLADSLLKSGLNLIKVFTPEHGFRGDQDAGQQITDHTDLLTGLPIVSLYGNKKKPAAIDLKGVQLVVFDLQDVGTRFYTYISTLSYVMEACAEHRIPLVVLDRPNPNGYFIDGPVLESKYSSFVGLHPVPVAYGLTIGEYALMVKGEQWIAQADDLQLTVIPVKGYKRNMLVELPAAPSPNLPGWEAVYLYPSLCFFEGTAVSVGRGTDMPFQVFGHPKLHKGDIRFTPKAIPGASMHPLYEGVECKGYNLQLVAYNFVSNEKKLHLHWLIEAYHALKDQTAFFNNYFDTLAGTDKLRQQIEAGVDESTIRESWKKDIRQYQTIRKKYLLYPDPPGWFEQ
ncbi:MAG: DUF1343 domain-containing protein [Bacteroidales bacterium]|jgi:uncharacterized protein YbbC (DUF1343 family)|nr:DUF1343 domain-containing protein [Bacteroidales bacterium]MDD3701481.1 DUF1343 domain-containing protein [Bacteroidales bacterium]MDY0369208.1 DUF1343 domain-containing protein [Bacteroidales bacterium]